MVISKSKLENASEPIWKSFFFFVGSLKEEMKKINWTSKNDLLNYARVVVIASFVFGFAIYFMDITFHLVIQFLRMIIRSIVG